MTAITALTETDHDDWLRLWRGYLAFYRTELADTVTEATFARAVAGDGIHGAIARDAEGRAVGFAHWLAHSATWTTSAYCYLEDLFVDPDARRGGVGAALIAHVRAWAADEGCAKLYWLTRSDNATARSLYDRVAAASGFVHYEIRLDGSR